jgi:hypothetical protein
MVMDRIAERGHPDIEFEGEIALRAAVEGEVVVINGPIYVVREMLGGERLCQEVAGNLAVGK